MSATARRRVSATAVVAALAAAHCLAVPAARALVPPVVDPANLPEPAPAGPRVPTAQRESCAVARPLSDDVRPESPWADLGFDAVWHLTRGEGQRVAVIDTGVAPHHRFGTIEGTGDYVSTGDGTQDCDGHGTVVAGIIAAAPESTGGAEFSGVAPAATVLAIRQSSTKFGPADDPGRTGFGDVDTMAAAVRTAADRGASVINISLVACATGNIDDAALGAALAYAVDTKDAVVVAAAGNVGGPIRCPAQPEDGAAQWDTSAVAVSPAWYDDYVLTVASVGGEGAPSAFTLAGPWVDVAAPGEDLISLHPSGHGLTDALPTAQGMAPISGTSYAAPVVSGLAALIRSRFPDLTARQVMHRIESTAHRPAHGWDPRVGNGVIDPVAALSSENPSRQNPLPPPRPVEPVATPAPAVPRSSVPALVAALVCVALVLASLASSRRRVRDDISGQ